MATSVSRSLQFLLMCGLVTCFERSKHAPRRGFWRLLFSDAEQGDGLLMGEGEREKQSDQQHHHHHNLRAAHSSSEMVSYKGENERGVGMQGVSSSGSCDGSSLEAGGVGNGVSVSGSLGVAKREASHPEPSGFPEGRREDLEGGGGLPALITQVFRLLLEGARPSLLWTYLKLGEYVCVF